jgi:hypothetical protein
MSDTLSRNAADKFDSGLFLRGFLSRLCETVLLRHRVAPRFTELHRENGFSTGSLVPLPKINIVFGEHRAESKCPLTKNTRFFLSNGTRK